MPLTTNDTTGRDLRASLSLRHGVPTGNTWGAIKAAMTVLGVRDDDRIASIEYGVMQFGSGRIVRDDAPDGIEIKEVA
jgi:hypothetical protein